MGLGLTAEDMEPWWIGKWREISLYKRNCWKAYRWLTKIIGVRARHNQETGQYILLFSCHIVYISVLEGSFM